MKKYGIFDNLKFVLIHIWKWDKAVLLFIAISAAAGALLPLAGIYLPKIVIDLVSQQASTGKLITIVLSFTMAMAAMNMLNKYADGYVNASAMANRMRYLFMSNTKAMTCDYENIESAAGQHLRDKLNAAINSERGGPQMILRILPTFASSLAGIVLYGSVLSTLSPWILILIICTSFVNYAVLRRITRILEKFRDAYSKMIGKFYYVGIRLQDFQTGKDVRLFNMKPWFMDIFRDLLKQDKIRLRKTARKEYRSTLADAAMQILRDGIAYGFLLYGVTSGNITISDFVLYFGAVTGFSGFIGTITKGFNDMVKASLDIQAVREFLDMPDRERGTRENPGTLPASIEFDHVTFRYSAEGPDILKDLCLVIKPGEKLALVGLNGAGKTTMVKLLCGFYQPTEGEIRINGIPLNQFSRDAAYQMFSAVFQNIIILPVPAAQNIAMDLQPDLGRVRMCLESAGLSERLPDLNAPLTKVNTAEGIELSGGEQQKLLLARALYKDAPILLLDEPTAALDPIAESRLYESYYAFSQNKTSIYISHRLASASFCDRVAFLENGRIAEQGAHQELIQLGGGYAHMYEIQSHYYREEAQDE